MSIQSLFILRDHSNVECITSDILYEREWKKTETFTQTLMSIKLFKSNFMNLKIQLRQFGQ